MRPLSIAFVVAVLAAGCRTNVPDGNRAEAVGGPPTAINPCPNYPSLPSSGRLDSLITDPAPNAEHIITLKPGEPLKIMSYYAPPKLGFPGMMVNKMTDTLHPFGPGGGQHVEILVDDEEESARISTELPIVFNSFPDGTHIVRIYLCAADNESVKSRLQVGMVQVNINRKTNDTNFSSLPTIAYTQPMRACRARNAMLDYALHGVGIASDNTLMDGYSVYTEIRNDTGIVASSEDKVWRSSDIDYLMPDSTYTAVLRLQKAGKNVISRYASTRRTFRVLAK